MELNNGTYTKIALFVVIMCGFYYVVNTFSAPRPYPYYPQQQNGNGNGNSQVVMQQPNMPQTPDMGNVYDAIHKFDTAKVIDPLQDPITRNSLLNYGLPYDSYRQVGTLKCIGEDPPLSKKEMWDARYENDYEDNTYDGVQLAITNDDESTNRDNGKKKDKNKCKKGKCKKNKVKVETFINNSYNDILPLYGMQSNIITNIWFYYTIISDGNNSIKIMLNQPNNSGTTELWTGSVVYIPELNKTYEAVVNQTIFMTYG